MMSISRVRSTLYVGTSKVRTPFSDERSRSPSLFCMDIISSSLMSVPSMAFTRAAVTLTTAGSMMTGFSSILPAVTSPPASSEMSAAALSSAFATPSGSTPLSNL